MNENSQNDEQEVQPEEVTEQEEVVADEQESEEEVNPEVAKLREELAEKDKQISDLSRAKREAKKAQKATQDKDTSTSKTEQSSELDYAKKAYLRTEGIESSEFDFIQEQMDESGINDIEKLLQNNYFKSELKARRADAEILKATPPGSRRTSGTSAKMTVDYWVAKGELPPNEAQYQKLRQDVVNANVAKEKSPTNFAN